MSEFRDLLEAAAKSYPTKKAFARAIGITPGRLSRVLGGEHSLDVENCLTLARLTGESPSHVLRVAGKETIADAIERFYGPAALSVSPKDRVVLDAWHSLSQRAREGLLMTISELNRQSGADSIHVAGVPEQHTSKAAIGKSIKKPSGSALAVSSPGDQADRVPGAARPLDLTTHLEGFVRNVEQTTNVAAPARAARKPVACSAFE